MLNVQYSRILGLPTETWVGIAEILSFNIITSAIILAVACLSAYIRRMTFIFGPVILAFSLLGWTIGQNMAGSRDPAVSAVLPGVLTLVAGMLAYLMGAKGLSTKMLTCLGTIGFSVSLLVGSFAGARQRFEFESAINSPGYIVAIEDEREKARQALAAERLAFEAKFRQQRDELAKTYNVNLSDISSSDFSLENSMSKKDQSSSDSSGKKTDGK